MQGVISKEYDGKTRTLYPIRCLNCKLIKLVPKHILKDRKFCNRSCRTVYRNNNLIRYKTVCSLCGKAVLKHIGSLENSKSGKYFCNRQCKELAQSIDGGLILHPPHYIDGRRSYRYRAFKTYGKVCRVCGYSGYEKMLDVDHIDSNRKNNRIENLQVLCVWCHMLKTRGIVVQWEDRTPAMFKREFDFSPIPPN